MISSRQHLEAFLFGFDWVVFYQWSNIFTSLFQYIHTAVKAGGRVGVNWAMLGAILWVFCWAISWVGETFDFSGFLFCFSALGTALAELFGLLLYDYRGVAMGICFKLSPLYSQRFLAQERGNVCEILIAALVMIGVLLAHWPIGKFLFLLDTDWLTMQVFEMIVASWSGQFGWRMDVWEAEIVPCLYYFLVWCFGGLKCTMDCEKIDEEEKAERSWSELEGRAMPISQ